MGITTALPGQALAPIHVVWLSGGGCDGCTMAMLGASEPSLEGVVDDSADDREVLAALLERYRAAVTPAASAMEALQRYAERRFDVLVSDIAMPEVDGYALIRQLRAQDKAAARYTPAIALTAYSSPEDRQRILLAGFQAHIAKPVHPGELVAAVASLSGRT
jgi:CheY-like chemotaxis protein